MRSSKVVLISQLTTWCKFNLFCYAVAPITDYPAAFLCFEGHRTVWVEKRPLNVIQHSCNEQGLLQLGQVLRTQSSLTLKVPFCLWSACGHWLELLFTGGNMLRSLGCPGSCGLTADVPAPWGRTGLRQKFLLSLTALNKEAYDKPVSFAENKASWWKSIQRFLWHRMTSDFLLSSDFLLPYVQRAQAIRFHSLHHLSD